MRFKNLNDLYIHELRDLYDAESKLIDALPKMAAKASSGILKECFEEHVEQTREQRQRIEQIMEDLGEDPEGEVCAGIQGLIKEGQEILNASGDLDTLDVALIAASNRVEHYEMAGYEAVRSHAQALGYEEHAELLQKTLDEEGAVEEKLNAIAEELHTEASDE